MTATSHRPYRADPSVDWNDRNSVMEEVKRDGRALQSASDVLKNDREIVMAAAMQKPRNMYNVLKFASPELRNDADLVVTALLTRVAVYHSRINWAVKAVRDLMREPGWEDRVHRGHQHVLAFKLLDRFPVTQSSPKSHQTLHNLVVKMLLGIVRDVMREPKKNASPAGRTVLAAGSTYWRSSFAADSSRAGPSLSSRAGERSLK